MPRALPSLAVLAAALLWSAPGVAQQNVEPSEESERRARARELADRGYELYQEGRFDEANSHFREAERVFHAPTFLLMIGRTYEGQGRLVDAKTVYQKIVAENLAIDVPPEFVDAQREAQRALGELEPRVPAIRFSWKGGPTVTGITIDGRPVPASASRHAIELDPGRHTIVVRREGAQARRHVLSVAEGESQRITIDASLPEPGVPFGATGATGEEVAATVSFVFAGLGLAAGVTGGVVAITQRDELDEVCTDDKQCFPEDERFADNATVAATFSTVGFIAAGVGAAAGITLLLINEPPSEHTAWQLDLGPTSVGVRGTF